MDYAALQTSISNWSGRTDSATVDEIPNFIAFATNSFNYGVPDQSIPPIRTRDMITTTTLTMTDGTGTLPSDYLQAEQVTSTNSPRRTLSFVGAGYVDSTYPFRTSGLPDTYTITGSELAVYPVSETDVQLIYYAAIPALSDSVTSNWLLAKLPALYLHAGLYQLGMYTKDNELMARSIAVVVSMIDGLNKTDQQSRYLGAPVKPRMFMP